MRAEVFWSDDDNCAKTIFFQCEFVTSCFIRPTEYYRTYALGLEEFGLGLDTWLYDFYGMKKRSAFIPYFPSESSVIVNSEKKLGPVK